MPPTGGVPAGDDLVAGLAAEVPLVLLPIRIVTRYERSTTRPGDRTAPVDGPADQTVPGDPLPTHLRVRIHPDLLHADAHEDALSADEWAAAQAYWRRIWRAAGDPAARAEAHAWLFSVLEPPRAVHVLGATTPRNHVEAPDRPVPAGRPLPVEPVLPTAATDRSYRVRAALLPERWSVTVLSHSEVMGTWWSEPVRADLALAPSLVDLPASGGIEDLMAADDLAWLSDFRQAQDAGMALRIPLQGELRRGPVDLVVTGVRRGTGHGPAWAALLESHRLSDGLDIVRPGSPTNTTETVASGWSPLPEDPEAFLAAQLAPGPGSRRPALSEPERLVTATAADALALTFGLSGPTALDRAGAAGDTAVRAAGAMNRVLWPATVGHTLSTVLAAPGAPLVPGDDLTWARDWFADWVRGGGPLPVFRIGSQPYGVLPVTPRPSRTGPATTRVEALEDLLDGLRNSWAATSAPALSPVAGGAGTLEEQAVLVGATLGAVPHPTAFRLRDAPVSFDALAAGWNASLADLEDILDRTSSNALVEFQDREARLRGSAGVVDQQAVVSQLITLFADWQTGPTGTIVDYQPALDHLRGVLRPLLAAHDYRSAARRHAARFSRAALADPADPPLWYVVYGGDGAAADGTFPALQLSPTAPGDDPAAVAAELRGLAAQASTISATSRPAVDPGNPRSLFRVLVDQALAVVHPDSAGELAAGLEDLADLVEDDTQADPLAELQRLLRETLGLATHRYDAWVTSLATRRLARRRAATPESLQIGCYGWVVGLEADAGGPDTSGFVHAPTLDHAATAAILRSSWLAHADDAGDAAFAVDLSSDRVRRATWLLDGVRAGRDLAELLGGRFERRLHDAELDDLLDDLRRAVRGAAPAAGIPGTVVDGLALAVAYTDVARTAGTDPVLVAVEAVRLALPAPRARRLASVLRDGVVDLDAVADALVAQGVHSLVKGNLAQAAATLSAAGSGDSGVPELTVAVPHRDAQVVTCRVVAVLPAGSPPDPAVSRVRELVEPALWRWLTELLPGIPGQPVRVELLDAKGRAVGEVATTVGRLGLDAVDVLALVPPDGALPGSRLARLLEGAALLSEPVAAASTPTTARLDPDAAEGDGPSLAELVVAVAALRSSVARSRPLRAADLSPADGDPDVTGPDVTGPDVGELEERRRVVAGRLMDLAGQAPSDELFRNRISDLLAVDPHGTATAAGAVDPAARRAALAGVLRAARRAADGLRADDPEGWTGWPAQARADHLAGRLAAALAGSLPVLPRCSPAVDALSASLSGSARRLGSPVAVTSWLLEAGRVHDGAGALSESIGLTEALGMARWDVPVVAQLPDLPGEPWLATERPVAGGARLCLVSVTDAGPALRAGPVTGLLFDGWTETIPDGTTTTGIAVHLDSPGARPPQTLLVATLQDGERWTSDSLVALVRETLDLARFRAVGPDSLLGWGHTLPGIFLPADARVALVDEGTAIR